MHNANKIKDKILEAQRLVSEEIQEERTGSRTDRKLKHAREYLRLAHKSIRSAQNIHDFGVIDE